MFKVLKSGSNEFGSWANIEFYVSDNYIISCIARTDTELQPGDYTGAKLVEAHRIGKDKKIYTNYSIKF